MYTGSFSTARNFNFWMIWNAAVPYALIIKQLCFYVVLYTKIISKFVKGHFPHLEHIGLLRTLLPGFHSTDSQMQKIQFQANGCLLLATTCWSKFMAAWMLPGPFLKLDWTGGTLMERVQHNRSPFLRLTTVSQFKQTFGSQTQVDTGAPAAPAPLIRNNCWTKSLQ